MFVTDSTVEAHNLLMLRMSRVRRKDPVLGYGIDASGTRYCSREAPDVTQDLSGKVILGIPAQELAAGAPSCEERRHLMTREMHCRAPWQARVSFMSGLQQRAAWKTLPR